MEQPKNNIKGFTLIELMIVVAIIAIIAGIAYPSYMESVMRSNRADAKVEINDVAQRLQRCFTLYNDYTHSNCTVHGQLTGGNKITSDEGFYELSLTAVSATTYTLTASPVAGRTQAKDSKCKSFTMTHTGAQGATGDDTTQCW